MELNKKNLAMTGATLASAALYGLGVYLGFKSPLPGRPQDIEGGLAVEDHEFDTADGVTLRLKRYANPGGSPVLLCHGFGGCGTSFDLPSEGHNLAVFLARQGFDVWISSWRGCGNEPYASGCGDWTHTIDDLAIYDAPALVDGVAAATGKRVFWIGHSMGGHILYMYLQGVRFEDGHVVSDPQLVAERHEKLSGGITAGSPPGFRYEKGEPYSMVFGSRAGKAVLNAMNQEMLKKEVTAPHVSGLGGVGNALEKHPRIVMAFSRTPFVIFTYCRRNTDKDTTTMLAMLGQGDASAGMYVQLFSAILDEQFLEHPGRCSPGTQYDYTSNMGLVSLPIFFLTGTGDFANAATIKALGYDRVASVTKEYVCLEGYGHTDLIMGRNVEREVFPLMSGWIRSVVEEPDSTDEVA
jgi:pimeloyl-ACP methyl ester carboxylesterase